MQRHAGDVTASCHAKWRRVLGFRFWVLGFRVHGLGFKVLGLGFGV